MTEEAKEKAVQNLLAAIGDTVLGYDDVCEAMGKAGETHLTDALRQVCKVFGWEWDTKEDV